MRNTGVWLTERCTKHRSAVNERSSLISCCCRFNNKGRCEKYRSDRRTTDRMSDSTPTDPQQGNGNSKMKKQQFSKPGVIPGMTDARLESMAPGLDKSIMFVYGSPHQIEKFLRARKAIVDWVGTSKECKKSMLDCLTEGTEPEFTEPEEPTPAKEGDPISKPQMEKCSMKLRKFLSDEEDWEESKGGSFRTEKTSCQSTRDSGRTTSTRADAPVSG